MKCLDAINQHNLEFLNLRSNCQKCGINITFCTHCYKVQPALVIPDSFDGDQVPNCTFCLQDLQKPTNMDFIMMNKILSPLEYRMHFFKEFEQLKLGLETQKKSLQMLLTGDHQIQESSTRIRRRKRTKIIEWGIDYSGWLEFLRLREILEILKDGSYLGIKNDTNPFTVDDLKVLEHLLNDKMDIISAARTISKPMPMVPIKIETDLALSKQFLGLMQKRQQFRYDERKMEIQQGLKLVLQEIERFEALETSRLDRKIVQDTIEMIRRDPFDLASLKENGLRNSQQLKLLKQLYSTSVNQITP